MFLQSDDPVHTITLCQHSVHVMRLLTTNCQKQFTCDNHQYPTAVTNAYIMVWASFKKLGHTWKGKKPSQHDHPAKSLTHKLDCGIVSNGPTDGDAFVPINASPQLNCTVL